jgi:copper transport protein
MRRGGPALVLTALAMLLAPSAVLAHATLEDSSPAGGATAKRQPDAVVFSFNEPVEANFGALRVYGAEGARVEEGDAFHPGGEGSKLGVGLKPGLPGGSYTATYRVVSADGHIVSGGFVFSIGKQGRAPRETVAELVGGGGSDALTEVGLGVARGVQYAALALALGALAFFLLVFRPAWAALADGAGRWARASAAFERRLRTAFLGAALAGIASALAAVVLHAAEAAGVSAGSALDATILREELGTRFGTVWGLTAIAWLAAALAAAPALRGRRWRAVALLAPLGFIALEPALSGHPSTQSPVVLLFGANVLHVVAMAVWVGGLAALAALLPAATSELEAPERSRALAAALARFSPIALLCVAAILLTGLGQGYAYVRDLDNLLDTAYGRAVLIKLAIAVCLLVPLGAHNRYRSAPRLKRIAAGGEAPGRAGLVLRRALRSEVALVVVVLGVTAALAGYPPATASRSGPFSTSASLGPAELEVTVDPALAGPNQIHLHLFDARSGEQFTRARELTVTATEPEESIGPLSLEPRRSGPGHYTVQGAPLSVAGDWDLDVTMRVSAFDQYESVVEVPVR